MSKVLTVIPAYGRKYSNRDEIIEDYKDGKDFKSVGMGGSGYINKADAEQFDISELNVRYANRTKKLIIKVDDYAQGQIMIAKKHDPTGTSAKHVVEGSREHRKYKSLGYVPYIQSKYYKNKES